AIIVHALKSTAKMIGATELSVVAKKLEDAAKDKNEEIIQESHDWMLAEYEKLSEGILEILGVKGTDEENGEDEILDFAPQTSEDDVLEFEPQEEEVLEFNPQEEEVLEFNPEEEEVLEFGPEEEEVLEFSPEGGDKA
ncbi:MAG: Hpt domain-containing protein, partial [Acetatifactor sp.]|nr:Hpt domain-containing protein [Acetatifactor sp.]